MVVITVARLNDVIGNAHRLFSASRRRRCRRQRRRREVAGLRERESRHGSRGRRMRRKWKLAAEIEQSIQPQLRDLLLPLLTLVPLELLEMPLLLIDRVNHQLPLLL